MLYPNGPAFSHTNIKSFSYIKSLNNVPLETYGSGKAKKHMTMKHPVSKQLNVQIYPNNDLKMLWPIEI